MTIHSSELAISGFTHLESITLNAGWKINWVAGNASVMNMDGIWEVGDKTSKQ